MISVLSFFSFPLSLQAAFLRIASLANRNTLHLAGLLHYEQNVLRRTSLRIIIREWANNSLLFHGPLLIFSRRDRKINSKPALSKTTSKRRYLEQQQNQSGRASHKAHGSNKFVFSGAYINKHQFVISLQPLLAHHLLAALVFHCSETRDEKNRPELSTPGEIKSSMFPYILLFIWVN